MNQHHLEFFQDEVFALWKKTDIYTYKMIDKKIETHFQGLQVI